MSIITLDRLLNNTPIEVHVPGVGKVRYRMPTKEDRLEAKKLARTHPFWDELSELEKLDEDTAALVLQILVEPKITYEDYLKAREDYMEAIIQVVAIDLTKRLEAIRDKRSKILSDFLEQMKAKIPETSTGYSSNVTSTGNWQEVST